MEAQEILSMADERFERRLAQEAASIRQEVASVRHELTQEIAAVRQELKQDIAGVRQEVVQLRRDMDARFDAADARFATREDMAVGFARIEQRIAESRAELVKWSFLFWTGQCITMIGFLLVFLKNR